MNQIINKLKSILDESYPNIQYDLKNPNDLFIPSNSKNGYDIFLKCTLDESIIYFNSWHWHFQNTEDGKNELVQCFGLGLSSAGRLKTFLKNGKEYKWTFESFNQLENKWYPMGTVGVINLKFWLKSEVKYYQNDLIQLNERS